jgi:acetyl-CoA carboxylase carboxyl transferase beta subunit
MLNRDSFKKTDLWLEKHSAKKLIRKMTGKEPGIPDEMWKACPLCKETFLTEKSSSNYECCPACGSHFIISARSRIEMVVDEESFQEFDAEMMTLDRIGFPGYSEKIKKALEVSRENEAVLCGEAKIMGHELILCVMEPGFIMGSMGTVVGEKITRAFERAIHKRLPIVVFCASGGARMQEGIFSLMQMAKTSGAVKLHSDAGLLYISFLTNPTTGGVTASFAMQGDIILAEPGALVGFAGPRVIEQTIKQKLPKGFQSAEFLLEKGFCDAIVPRKDIRSRLGRILQLHVAPEKGGPST